MVFVSMQLQVLRACPRGCCWPSRSCSACWRANRSASPHWRNRWRTWCRTASFCAARLITSQAIAPRQRSLHRVQQLKVSDWTEAVWSFYLKTFIMVSFFRPQFLNQAKCSIRTAKLERENGLLLVPLPAATLTLRGPTLQKCQLPQVSTEGRNATRTRKSRRKGRTTAGREVRKERALKELDLVPVW